MSGGGFWATLASLAKDKDSPAGALLMVVGVFATVILLMGAFMAFPFIMSGIFTTGNKVMKGEVPMQSIWRNCFDFKSIDGVMYKIDQCNGKIEPYKKPD